MLGKDFKNRCIIAYIISSINETQIGGEIVNDLVTNCKYGHLLSFHLTLFSLSYISVPTENSENRIYSFHSSPSPLCLEDDRFLENWYLGRND